MIIIIIIIILKLWNMRVTVIPIAIGALGLKRLREGGG